MSEVVNNKKWSLIFWRDKTSSVELTSGVDRKQKVTMITCKFDDKAHLGRVLFTDDDEDFLDSLMVDKNGTLYRMNNPSNFSGNTTSNTIKASKISLSESPSDDSTSKNPDYIPTETSKNINRYKSCLQYLLSLVNMVLPKKINFFVPFISRRQLSDTLNNKKNQQHLFDVNNDIVELFQGSSVKIHKDELEKINTRNKKHLPTMVGKLLKAIVGDENLVKMTAYGIASQQKQAVPHYIYRDIRRFVNTVDPENALDDIKYRDIVTNYCRKLRNPKKIE